MVELELSLVWSTAILGLFVDRTNCRKSAGIIQGFQNSAEIITFSSFSQTAIGEQISANGGSLLRVIFPITSPIPDNWRFDQNAFSPEISSWEQKSSEVF